MSKKISQVTRQLTNIADAFKSEELELVEKATSDFRAEFEGLHDMAEKEMKLLRDPFAQCN